MMNTIRMGTTLQDQVADGVDLGLEDHLPSAQLLSLCVLMVAEMKILTIMMTMGVEVIIKIIIFTMLHHQYYLCWTESIYIFLQTHCEKYLAKSSIQPFSSLL